MKIKLLSISILLAVSGSLSAAEIYNSNNNYPGGEQVEFNGNIYEAQWWANPGQTPAGITENSWDSPWVWVSEIETEVPPVLEPETALVHYFENKLIIKSWSLDAGRGTSIYSVEKNKDRIYAGILNSSNTSSIYVYDSTTGERIDRIDASTNEIKNYVFIEDLHVDNDRLFVSARSNTVDIYDLNNQNKLISRLGTGKSWGDNSLDGTKGVTSNQDLVFVVDSSATIKVYRQQDITAENSLATPQYAHLAFEETYSSDINMEVIGNYLIASDVLYTYVYDLNQLDAAVNNGQALKHYKKIEMPAYKIDSDENSLVIHTNEHIAWYNIDALIESDFDFESQTPEGKVTSIEGWDSAVLRDINFSDGELVIADSGITVEALQDVEINFVPNQSVETAQLKFEQIMPTSVSSIMENDESHMALVNNDSRSFKVNSPIKTQFIDRNTIQITSFAAVELKDVNIELKHNAMDKWFTVATLDRIPAFTQITLPVSALGDGKFNTSEKNGYIDISALYTSPLNIKSHFDYRFNSDSDKFAQKLASIKPDWELNFWDVNKFYDPTLGIDPNCGWQYINALYAREWTAMMTNLAYMVSQEEFEHVWFNFNDVFGYDMHGNAGSANTPNGKFTEEDYQHWFDALMNREEISLGVTAKEHQDGNKLAMGVSTESFYTHYYGHWRPIAKAFGMGFDGKQAFEGNHSFVDYNGWVRLVDEMANYHIRKGDLPYADDNTTGFYKVENANYQYGVINNNLRVHRDDSDINTVEAYFQSLTK